MQPNQQAKIQVDCIYKDDGNTLKIGVYSPVYVDVVILKYRYKHTRACTRTHTHIHTHTNTPSSFFIIKRGPVGHWHVWYAHRKSV